MAVWSHRVTASIAGAQSNLTVLLVATGRTAILNRIDMDVDTAGAGVIRWSLIATGVSLRIHDAVPAQPGPQTPLNVERRVMHPGDILRLTVGAGTTVEYWVSYLLLEGEPT